MPSSPQTVTTRGVFDYLYNSAGKAIVGATVNCTLNFNGGSVTSPIVNLGELQQSTVTDQNGFWRFLLVPNDTITPTGTLYTIQSGNIANYDISVPSGGADVQSSSILANTPSVLSPALTNLTGPITVTGNETVTGNLSVTGTTTLGSTTTGATTTGTLSTGAETVGGDLTISSAFRLLFGAAVSKIIPGATSISLRDNADANDNLIVTNAGAATVRNGLTVTAGGLTVTAGGATVTAGDLVATAGRLLISAAAAKILGGATSLSLRNNADSADNVLVADAGAVTLRNSISMPPTAAGTVASSAYGSLPVLIAVNTPGAVISFTQTVPSGFRRIEIQYIAQRATGAGTFMAIQLNGDTAAHYFSNADNVSNQATGFTAQENLGATSGWAGTIAAANPSVGVIRIHGTNQSTLLQSWTAESFFSDGGATGQLHVVNLGGVWTGPAAVITSITVLIPASTFSAGSTFEFWGYP